MKERLDILLVRLGLAASRERARSLIMEGKVLVRGVPATKAGVMVPVGAAVTLKGVDIPYVSRGGMKLRAAIEHFGISPAGLVAIDVGSSTGGFTDCMLQLGAARVYCIDVGYGQLAWQLRQDPRVVLLERTNIRYLERDRIPGAIDLATIDVSFISLRKVLERVMEFLRPGGGILALVKPQFEVGRGEVGKGGIVRDEELRRSVVNSLQKYAEGIGLDVRGVFESPVPGQKGNREYFMHLRKP